MGDQRGTGGITAEGIVVQLDIAAVRKHHDVNDGDENCRICGTPYPCPLLDIAEQLDEWLRSAPPQTPAPSGAGNVKE